MNCPLCNNPDTKVADSRIAADGSSIRRRRECAKCGFRFSTSEEITLLDLTVIKRNGRREPYSRDKLIGGLNKALEKRAVTSDRFKRLVNKIETDIQKTKKNEITSEEIGEIVMRHLERFDKVAFIRFASVYRQFEDVKTFQRELAKLTRTKRKKAKR